MSKLSEIRAKGYNFVHGVLSENDIVSVNDDYLTNKYHIVIIKPDGEKVAFTGYLDSPASISGVQITRREIIQEMFNPTDEDWTLYENGYGSRTKNYFGKIYENIGVLKCVEFDDMFNNSEAVDVEPIKTLPIFFNADVTIGKYESNFIAQYSVRHDIDAFSTTQITFDHYPSENDIRTAIDIKEMKSRLLGGDKEEYVCHSCSKKIHWLDVDGDLKTKINKWEEKYCGC